MSNGDDVLDNWEEFDEAGLNSTVQKLKTPSTSNCEEIIQSSCLDINLSTSNTDFIDNTITTVSSRPTQMKVLQRSNTLDPIPSSSVTKPLTESPLNNTSATFQPVVMVLHKPQDEYQSANYTAPIANQTVKILRRPTQSGENRNNCIRPKQPIKTLQQREQEYAEARLRILGSAKNPEDEEQLKSKNSTTAPTAVSTSINISAPSNPTVTSTVVLTSNSIMNMSVGTKINSPKLQVSGANQFNNQYNQQLQQQQQQQKYQQNYQQQQQQNYFYNQQQQQQQQPQPPVYNNNRTYNMNPLLALGPMGAIGQPAQYHTTNLSSPQAPQQHLKFQQYPKAPQQQNKSQQQQTWSPVVGGSVSSSSIRQQQNDILLRSPRGPDGSTGFQMRR